MTSKLKRSQFLNGFVLKLLAILTMTIDHVGILLQSFGYESSSIFRVVGRCSLPLFAFLIVEGVLHTKNFGKYAIRLGIGAAVMAIALGIANYCDIPGMEMLAREGNIFIDLLLGASAVYLLRRKENYLKVISLLPLGISVISFICTCYENSQNAVVYWYPTFLRTQYGFYATALIIGYYLSYVIKDIIFNGLEKSNGLTVDCYPEGSERLVTGLVSLCFLAAFTIVFVMTSSQFKFGCLDVQWWAILFGVLPLFYSGKRGYNSKWFQYGCYIYYPLH